MQTASSFLSSTRYVVYSSQKRLPPSPVAIALQDAAEDGAVADPLAGVAAEAERLKVGDVVRTTVVLRDDVINLQRRLVLMGPTAFTAALRAREHPVADRSADGRAMA